jgi:endonuclease I/DNA/RNA endonuclease YhcR with UshA esterase domain
MNFCDADPANPSNIILFYTQRSQKNDTYGTGGNDINREHVWAKSHGSFANIRPMDSDVHNLHPADASVNQVRSNRDFDKVAPNGTQITEAPGTWYNTNAWEPADAVKGQVARAILYMDVRYEGTNGEMDLTAADGVGTYPQPKHGNLQTLLEWHRQFPPTGFERRRNERIFNMQLNRNPFVDHPEYADLIWGSIPAPTIQITGNSISPAVPVEDGSVQLSVSVSSVNAIASVVVFWGKSYNSEEKSFATTLSGNNYQAEINLNGFSGGEYLYYKVVASDVAQNQRVRHFSAFIHKNIPKTELTSLSAIQGTQEASPLINQKVTVSGRVSKIIDSEYFIQNDGQRESVCIYSGPETGAVGDSVVISGTVTEYNNLTEIKDIIYFCNLKNNQPITPLEVKANEINEDMEGRLVTIKNATFLQSGTTIPDNGGSYTFTDGSGSLALYVNYSSKLIGQKLPTGTTTITGIISQYKSDYQLIIRDVNDFKSAPTIVLPELSGEENPFRVFPNPAMSGNIQIQAPSPSMLKHVTIRNLSGQLLLQEKIDSETKQIDVSRFPPGAYLVLFQLQNGDIKTCKLIKK